MNINFREPTEAELLAAQIVYDKHFALAVADGKDPRPPIDTAELFSNTELAAYWAEHTRLLLLVGQLTHYWINGKLGPRVWPDVSTLHIGSRSHLRAATTMYVNRTREEITERHFNWKGA